jgi:hypothetical protein
VVGELPSDLLTGELATIGDGIEEAGVACLQLAAELGAVNAEPITASADRSVLAHYHFKKFHFLMGLK